MKSSATTTKRTTMTRSDLVLLIVFVSLAMSASSQQLQQKIDSLDYNEQPQLGVVASSATTKSGKHIIYVNERAYKNIRLKSVLTLNKQLSESRLASGSVPIAKTQKIFWSFKRIYTIPKFDAGPSSSSLSVKSTPELSQTELMISLDGEVQTNLREKYSIGENDLLVDENEPALSSSSPQPTISVNPMKTTSSYDLVINNLTYADAGLYKCNLWNQRTIYYHLIVTSN
jgi:hypothetical protein